jgi:hypothetical protein
MTSSRRSFVFLLILVSLLTVPAELADAQARPPECNQKCVRGYDTAWCEPVSGFGGGKNCKEWSECTIHAVDADGAGPGAPIIFVSCAYRCTVDFCVWV